MPTSLEDPTLPAETRPRPAPSSRARGPRRRIAAGTAIVVVVAGCAAIGARAWVAASGHVATDDAYLTSSVVQVSPQVAGTVQQVLVDDNQDVRQGDLLIVLDDAVLRASVAQAEANLSAAIAQAQGSRAGVSLSAEGSTGQETQAQGAVQQADTGILAARADAARAEAAVTASSATSGGAQAAIATARAGLDASVAAQGRARSGVRAAEAQCGVARAAIDTAQAGVRAAEAARDRAARDAARYAKLASQGAVSDQTSDQATTGARVADAQLDSARQQLEQARMALSAREAEVEAARDQATTADAAISQARAQLAATREQARSAQAGVLQARAAADAARQTIRQAVSKRQQALGQYQQARAARHQVAVSRTNEAQARSRIEQARAALAAARTQLGYTRIYAPVTGRVSRKTAEPGGLAQPGSPLLALVPANRVWVVANYKETQLARIRPGQSAVVRVDALPGRTFRGTVDSVSAATGSTFALLPAENASGNFTKVVQRVPVKIVLDPRQPGLADLRAGTSVVASVATR